MLGEARRGSPRVRLELAARCVFADGHDAPATIRDASCLGVAVDCGRSDMIGEPVVIEIEHLERFDGRIVRRFRSGFAVELRMTRYRRDRLRETLERLAADQGSLPAAAVAPA